MLGFMWVGATKDLEVFEASKGIDVMLKGK